MTYDAAKDAHDSYYAAIEAKRERGDSHDWEGRAKSFLDGRVTLYPGDCLDVLASLPANSVDSVVCDPPYHLTSIVKRFGADGAAEAKSGATGAYRRASAGFMGKQWDGGDIAFQPATWAAVLRVLKPGGHLLAFSATRSYHRMAVAIEDGGFEVRDQIGWAFGQGFPKSHNVGNGWGTALKPAWEPICVARKPLSESSIAANVLKHGTGAINIGACRIVPPDASEHRSDDSIAINKTVQLASNGRDGEASAERRYTENGSTNFAATPGPRGGSPLGRWPANLIHDGSEEVLGGFPETGTSAGGTAHATSKFKNQGAVGDWSSKPNDDPNGFGFGDSGSAARFFYTAKADSLDRVGSRHPTVKPLDLMQYLCRLVTPPGGTVLDLFAGTGTTGEAAWREGFNAILIEREPEYQADIARRMELALKPTKRAAVAKTKNNLQGAEGTPLFGSQAKDDAA